MSRSKASGLSAALGCEQFGLELTAERLGPNGVNNFLDSIWHNTSPYLRIEALGEYENEVPFLKVGKELLYIFVDEGDATVRPIDLGTIEYLGMGSMNSYAPS